MCETKDQGGRRCDKGFGYSRQIANLQAKKQYHEKLLRRPTINDSQKRKSERILNTTLTRMNELREEHKEYGKGINYHMALTPATEKVLNVLEDHGMKAYIVGGSVRDQLLGSKSKDIDIEVYGADANKVAATLRTIGKVDEVGKSFGVLKIVLDGEDFDVSLPRKDNKTGDSHTDFTVDVDPNLSLEEATTRRDYTINSLMYSHKHGYIIDKHGGLNDLKNSQLKHVSDAFDEDPLRVLRGVQMASRFSMSLHPDTVTKAKSLKNQFDTIAKERVREEFMKLYTKGKSTSHALELLQQTGWDENFPGLKKANTPELRKKVARMDIHTQKHNITKNKALYTSAVIASGIYNETERMAFLDYTTHTSKEKNNAYQLTTLQPSTPMKAGSVAAIKQWAKDMPSGLTIEDWATIETQIGDYKTAESIVKLARQHNVNMVPEKDIVPGEHVTQLGGDRRAGRWIGRTVNAMRTAQYEGKFTDLQGGLAWLKNNGIVE